MAGLWLKDGLHLNITNQLAKELAEKMRKGISVLFLGSEVIAVKQDCFGPMVKLKNNHKKLQRYSTKSHIYSHLKIIK